jgi:S1-C subfamily serine protease
VAIPSRAVRQFVEQPAASYSLGLTVREVEHGLLVLGVQAGGAAAQASLLTGDLLVGVEGQPLRTTEDLAEARDASSGLLRVGFRRGGSPQIRQVTLVMSQKARAA